jgi:hypothetical protein
MDDVSDMSMGKAGKMDEHKRERMPRPRMVSPVFKATPCQECGKREWEWAFRRESGAKDLRLICDPCFKVKGK